MSNPSTHRELTGRLGRVGVWLTSLGYAPAAAERKIVAELESLGYPALWVGEAPNNKEAFAHAGILLAASERIAIATGIANIYARDATAANAAARALSEAYPGRFLLGLGVSHADLVAPRGHAYGKPLAAMRAYLDGLDAAPYAGPAAEQPVPRVLAALRPKMLELARDRADGAHTYFVPPRHTAQARALLGPDALLAPEQAVLLEPDPERARAAARDYMAFYLGQPNYVNALLELGFEQAEIDGGGSDRLVDAIVAWGDGEAVAARVREHLDAGADHVAVQPIAPDPTAALAQLRALAPALLAV